jgi:uncharacterized protein YecE (DUF72 family)
MALRTPPSFRFFVKAHGSFTHERTLRELAHFRRALEPMTAAGKLAGLLFQFPQSFKNTAPARRYIERLAPHFPDTRLAVEFRDRSWATPGVLRFLEDLGLGLVCVDEPPIPSLFPRIAAATAPFGYLRFHSRNAANWYADGKDRYDYRYTERELAEWLPLLETIARRARDVFVYFNNCHGGNAAANAEAMKALIRRHPIIADRTSESRA